MSRLAVVTLVGLVGLVMRTATAEACQPGYPCTTHYSKRPYYTTEPVLAYQRATTGAIPKWHRERVAKFLAASRWLAQTAKKPESKPSKKKATPVKSPSYRKPQDLVLVTPDLLAHLEPTQDRVVTQQRIEKVGDAILVEVDGQAWELVACKGKRSYACLVPSTVSLPPAD